MQNYSEIFDRTKVNNKVILIFMELIAFIFLSIEKIDLTKLPYTQHGWIWELLIEVKEVKEKRLHTLCFHLREIPEKAKL